MSTVAAPAVASVLLWAGAAAASSLQVSPVSFDLNAGVKTAQLTLQNLGDAPIDAQIRVFRWSQVNGAEQLTPTADLVASPPAASLAPHQDYIVRLVRIADRPVAGEESYRLLVDELPPPLPTNSNVSTVRLFVRYSVPVFFAQPDSSPQLTWSASVVDRRLQLMVRNDGSQHIRISALKVQGPGLDISFGEGLVGYVLAHSTAQWTARPVLKSVAAGTALKITALGGNGPVSATALLQAATH
jgi:fimbrial chaperone protein